MGNSKKRLKIKIVSLVLIFFISAGCPAFAEEVFVVVSKNVPIKTIDAKMVRSIFLGKKTIWPNGKSIEFVILDSEKTYKYFLKTYIKKTPSRYNIYWKKQVFTGKGLFPKTFSSENNLLEYISKRDNVIGYVSYFNNKTGVKVISRE